MASFKTFLLLFALVCLSLSYEHCIHDQIEQNPGFLDVEEDMSALEDGRLLQATNFPAIRLYPYYEQLKVTAPSTYVNYIQNDIIPPVFDYFQAAIKVKYPIVGNLTLGSSVTTICEINTPSILKTGGVATDMFVYFDSYADSSSQIANSKYCYLASGSNRPIITRINFNRNMFLDSKGDEHVHEKNIFVILHEMLHNFGFSGWNYNYYLDSTGKTRTGHVKQVSIGGKTRTVLDIPPLTEKLRNYYGCSTLPGAILENDGGDQTSSSHFERKYFIYETMSSGSLFGDRITEFSLALLEGTGWYIPDYTYAEPYYFGKGKGCNFINNVCSSTTAAFSEYCVGSDRGCAPHGRGGGNCWTDFLADNCRYVFPYQDNDCENDNGAAFARFPTLETYGRGLNSRCFTGNLNTMQTYNGRNAFCFKYNCVGSGTSTQLEIQVGPNKVVCTKAEPKTISGYGGSLDCPDPQTFCTTVGVQFCPRNCGGRGTCVSNKCVCKPGFKGSDCSVRA